MPGQANTVSVKTAPAIRVRRLRPITVTTGRMAFLSAWTMTTVRSGTPLERAKVMYSMRSTLIMLARVTRAMMEHVERAFPAGEIEAQRAHALGREQIELEREDQNQHLAEPECRDREP